jgi:hypothetical protein
VLPPLLAIALLSAPLEGSARDFESSPTLVILDLGTSEAERAAQGHFLTALRLALEGFAIELAPPALGFMTLSAPEQILVAQGVAHQHGAIAVIWIQKSPNVGMMLNLVAVDAQQTFGRVVETRAAGRWGSELALAVRELLGTAYLFAPGEGARPRRSPAIAKLSTEVRQQIGGAADLSLGMQLSGRGPLAAAPTTKTGAAALRLTADQELGGNWLASLVLEAAAGPRREREHRRFVGWDYGVAVGASYRVPLATELSLVPGALALIRQRQLDTWIDPGEPQTTNSTLFGLRAVGRLEWQLDERLSVLGGPELEWLSRQETFLRRSDGQEILVRPQWGWVVSFGAAILL